jgi:hypothetical protein
LQNVQNGQFHRERKQIRAAPAGRKERWGVIAAGTGVSIGDDKKILGLWWYLYNITKMLETTEFVEGFVCFLVLGLELLASPLLDKHPSLKLCPQALLFLVCCSDRASH